MLLQNIETINGKMLKAIYRKTLERRLQMKKLYERYKANDIGVPIKIRKYYIDDNEQKGKINNKLNNDFFSEIVDTKTGFFCGVPISYTVEDETAQETIKYFNTLNSMPDLDYETAKLATICGYSARLFYYMEDYVKAALLDPWEVVFIGDYYEDPKISIRFYEVDEIDETGKETLIRYADVYDDMNYYIYSQRDKDEDYILQYEEGHLIPGNPLIGFLNNEEAMGDCERVLSLIDAYDRTLSDVDSELEQFRLAYLSITGAEITEEMLEMAKRAGAFSLPGPEAKIEFIVKNLNDTVIENHLDRLGKNIYIFSRTPNMNDENFAGNIPGISLKFKFRGFEDKCKTSELKFKRALRQQYKLLSGIWQAKGKATFNYLDAEFTFTRNYPQNLIEEIDFLTKAKGVITEATAFSLVSFIENPQEEMELLAEQRQEDMDLFLANQPIVDDNNDQDGDNDQE